MLALELGLLVSNSYFPCRYVRDFEIETIGLKETTRRCSKAGCGAKLRDTVLDWEV